MAVLSVYFDCRASRPKSSETSTIPISTRRFLARASWVVAGTRGLDFAIATCRDNRGIQTGFDQIIAHGASAALRQIEVVLVGANVVGVAIDVDGRASVVRRRRRAVAELRRQGCCGGT